MNDKKAIEQLEEFLVIDDWSAVYMPELQDAIEYVINRINAERWIPVSEGLPKKEGKCLVTTDFGDVCEDSFVDGVFVLYLGNVIAWRPLPESYKEEENG